jgi:hypothetical protein
MSEKEHAGQTEVHKVRTKKAPVKAPESATDEKSSKISDAAKEASRTDDTVA